MQVSRGVEAEFMHRYQIAAINADYVSDSDQAWHHQESGEDAWDNQVFYRIGGEGGECVNLLGDAHGAEFGSYRRADAPGNDEPDQYGGQFAGDGDNHDAGNRAFGIESRKSGIGLQNQHRAGEYCGEADDGQRIIADFDYLADEAAEIKRRHHIAENFSRENREATEGIKECKENLAQNPEEIIELFCYYHLFLQVNPIKTRTQPG